jgi:hypothetical protein
MTREEKIKFLCDKYNESEDKYKDTDDDTLDMVFKIAYYGD